jgi:hypothetical protein
VLILCEYNIDAQKMYKIKLKKKAAIKVEEFCLEHLRYVWYGQLVSRCAAR